MNYKLVVDERAFVELENSVLYYKKVSNKLSIKFKKAIKKAIALISENPLLFQERYKVVRISFIKDFPFGVHYVLRGSEVRIIRFLHTSQFYIV